MRCVSSFEQKTGRKKPTSCIHLSHFRILKQFFSDQDGLWLQIGSKCFYGGSVLGESSFAAGAEATRLSRERPEYRLAIRNSWLVFG